MALAVYPGASAEAAVAYVAAAPALVVPACAGQNDLPLLHLFLSVSVHRTVALGPILL